MKKSRMLAVAMLSLAAGACIVVSSQSELKRSAVPLAAATAGVGAVALARVDSARLLGDVRTLASAEYAGRRTGTEGSRKAQAFLQARFEALGLRPFGGGFAEPFAFTHKSIKGLLTPGKAYKTEYLQPFNYIGFIPGSAKAARYIVVSTHDDHLGEKGGKLYPRADDNASGVAAMLAMAKWFKARPPQHSIVFAALPFPKAQLALNLNLDMLIHNDNDNHEIYAAGTSYTPALKRLVVQAAARHTVKVKLGHDRSQLVAGAIEDWTASSDHGPFDEAGVPFLYFGVEDHVDYHSPGDTFEHINQRFFVDVANLLVDVAQTAERGLR